MRARVRTHDCVWMRVHVRVHVFTKVNSNKTLSGRCELESDQLVAYLDDTFLLIHAVEDVLKGLFYIEDRALLNRRKGLFGGSFQSKVWPVSIEDKAVLKK